MPSSDTPSFPKVDKLLSDMPRLAISAHRGSCMAVPLCDLQHLLALRSSGRILAIHRAATQHGLRVSSPYVTASSSVGVDLTSDRTVRS